MKRDERPIVTGEHGAVAAELITSAQNARVKRLVALQQKSSERRREGLFVVEGRQELAHCLVAGYGVESVFVCGELVVPERVMEMFSHGRKMAGEGSENVKFFEVSRAVYEKMAYRGSTEGVVAVVRQRRWGLADLQLPERPLVVVMESVEKPGNLGAVLRSADAAGVDAVVVCDPLCDLYNPNMIRASVGAAFSVPTVACSSEECILFLKANGIRILTAQLQDSQLYYDEDMYGGTAIVMGTEHAGLTDRWRQAADAHIRIPMLGRVDSLNVSVSAAILMFEAVRQRQLRR